MSLPADLRDLLALSIRPLWAHSIVHLGKDVENRTWGTKFRGRFLIHSSIGNENQDKDDFMKWNRLASNVAALDWYNANIPRRGYGGAVRRGGIIGVAELVDCVHHFELPEPEHVASPWWIGPYGFILRNIRPVDFVPCPGRLGFFNPQIKSP